MLIFGINTEPNYSQFWQMLKILLFM